MSLSTTTATTTTTTTRAPQLLFDDGSRAMQQQQQQQQHLLLPDETTTTAKTNHNKKVLGRDPSISIRDYYEIDRLVQELAQLQNNNNNNNKQEQGWRNRIALQFPDELLADAPQVCWEWEAALPDDTDALVFCLGDTTYAPCCPDVVAAQHLQADCIVHYGHACLSPAVLPVLYSFGKQRLSVPAIVEAVAQQKMHHQQHQQDDDDEATTLQNLLVVYEVQYAHAMDDLQKALEPLFDNVLVGKIPANLGKAATAMHASDVSLCGQSTCGCRNETVTLNIPNEPSEKSTTTTTTSTESPEFVSTDKLVLGGLEIPPCQDWSKTTLLFIGQEDQDSRPLQNMLLRFATDPTHAPAAYWTWNTATTTLATELSSNTSRLLNRRFYLIQKAKLASIFGILVANPSDATTRPVVRHLQALIQRHGGGGGGVAQYNFMVGKVNPAKLANFPEVDAFCLVACPEHAWLQNERSDYVVPILTPLELAMAIGNVEWGSLPYSLDAKDFLKTTIVAVQESELANGNTGNDDGVQEEQDEDKDAPYFNPVTGRFESATRKKDKNVNLQVLPGKGQLTTYQSAAADFLKQRTYQGLSVDAGETAVQAAIPGQKGIASDYSNR